MGFLGNIKNQCVRFIMNIKGDLNDSKIVKTTFGLAGAGCATASAYNFGKKEASPRAGTVSGLFSLVFLVLFFFMENEDDKRKEREYDQEREKKREEGENYRNKRDIDGDYYRRNREADADCYRRNREADAAYYRSKRETDAQYKKDSRQQTIDEGVEEDNHAEEKKVTWIEQFMSKFSMPSLPPFLAQLMSGVPAGYKEAMLLHICSMLGAMCFSKVRALYIDLVAHAPNLQVIVEGNWSSGKGKFENIFNNLFARIIDSSREKIGLLEKAENQGKYIVQVTGLGTSMAKTEDIMAGNHGCHAYLFDSEVRALCDELKKGNGISFVFFRKAFENGVVCRNNRAKNSVNGFFPVFFNYTLTGTPNDISTTFRKELEGGTLSRIAWATIPEQGREPWNLIMPSGAKLKYLRDQIDRWRDMYCFHTITNGDEAVNEYCINLDYVNDALKEWIEKQYDQAKEEDNAARADVRMRVAAIAFHCAIIFHMLYDQPGSTSNQKRKQVVDLTLYVANYCMERFLHKFGKEQNDQREKAQNAEFVNDNYQKAVDESSPKQNEELITDIAELARLHSILDESGQHKYGWDKLSKMSGIPKSTLIRKISEYDKANKNKETD